MKSSDLKPGLFIKIKFGGRMDDYLYLVINVGPDSFRVRNLHSFAGRKLVEEEYPFNAVLYNDLEADPGPPLLDTIRIVPENEATAYLEKCAQRCDELVREAHAAIISNITLAETYRHLANTIIDEAHALAAT